MVDMDENVHSVMQQQFRSELGFRIIIYDTARVKRQTLEEAYETTASSSTSLPSSVRDFELRSNKNDIEPPGTLSLAEDRSSDMILSAASKSFSDKLCGALVEDALVSSSGE